MGEQGALKELTYKTLRSARHIVSPKLPRICLGVNKEKGLTRKKQHGWKKSIG